jgi:hypothetical protein
MQRGNVIETVGICFDRGGNIGLDVLDLDLCVDNYRPGRVGDAAINAGKFRLRESRGRNYEANEGQRHTE